MKLLIINHQKLCVLVVHHLVVVMQHNIIWILFWLLLNSTVNMLSQRSCACFLVRPLSPLYGWTRINTSLYTACKFRLFFRSIDSLIPSTLISQKLQTQLTQSLHNTVLGIYSATEYVNISVSSGKEKISLFTCYTSYIWNYSILLKINVSYSRF